MTLLCGKSQEGQIVAIGNLLFYSVPKYLVPAYFIAVSKKKKKRNKAGMFWVPPCVLLSSALEPRSDRERGIVPYLVALISRTIFVRGLFPV